MLLLKPNCEHCNKDLPPDSQQAYICTYECTFCQDCVETQLEKVCPNCGGDFVKRPIRPAQEWIENTSLQHHPASTERFHKPVDLEKHKSLLERMQSKTFDQSENTQDSPAPYKLHFIGDTTQLNNSIGLNIQLDPLPDNIEEHAWLFITGTEGERVDLSDPAIKASCQWLQDKTFERVISVCTGSIVLAHAGLLNQKQCTTHHDHITELQQLLTEKQVLDNRLFVEDGNTCTSAGVTSGIDLALYLIQQHHSPQLATDIARKMVLFTRRSSQDVSSSPWLENRNHLNRKIHAVQNGIQANPAKAWSLTELANIAHCSERHLVRLFRTETGLTTKEYIYKLRLTLAQQLLQNSQLTIETIANQCGFNDDRQFRRLWARQYNHPPSSYRKA